MKNILKKLSFLISFFAAREIYVNHQVDLTVVGSLNFSGSLSRISCGVIKTLNKDLSINFVPTIENSLVDIPREIKQVINKNKKKIGNVSLLTEILWHKDAKYGHLHKKMPNSKIKISYSMLESTAIPYVWVSILNNHFDAVAVPDEFLVSVYKNSGVKIPIFVLPLGVYLEDFLHRPIKKEAHQVFTFGCSAVGWHRKNLDLLVFAFIKAFGNSNNVRLVLHTKSSLNIYNLEKIIAHQKVKNIKIIKENLVWQNYVDLMATFDCYILLSKGEGFSITPREAMALGIPCILSNNTGHKVICNSGLVCPVKSEILESAYYDVFGQVCGQHFNCALSDVIKAMQNMHSNYRHYLGKAQQLRNWVRQYQWNNLKDKYLNLIKPKKLIFGKKNEITDNHLMTNSKQLYNKYMSILK